MKTIPIVVIILVFCVRPIRGPAPVPNQGGVCESLAGAPPLCSCYSDTVDCKSVGLADVPVPAKFPSGTKNLYLGGNFIHTIPSAAFVSMVNLEYLELSSLPLTTIADNAFLGLSRLVEIVIAGGPSSQLSTISSRTFAHLSALKKLNLQNNPITYIAGDAFLENSRLMNIKLGASLQCNCSLLPFKKWVDKNKSSFLTISGQCAMSSQGNTANQRLTEMSPTLFGDCTDAPVKTQSCYVCDDAKESATKCSRYMNCGSNQDACQTNYDSSVQNGYTVETIVKKCARAIDCVNVASENNVQCYYGADKSSCVSCCMGPRCNYRVFQGLEDTPPEFYSGECFEDMMGDNFFDRGMFLGNRNSPSLCKVSCKNGGYLYSGVTKSGNQCYCGHVMGKHPQRPRSECNYPCPGDKEEMCGGKWRISVYTTVEVPGLYCRGETIVDALRGTVIWPETLSGTTAEINCPVQIDPTQVVVLKRSCSKKGFWEALNLTTCSSKLEKLSLGGVTSSTVDAVASSLAEVTRNASVFGADDIVTSVALLDDILPFSRESNAESIVETFSNLMEASLYVLQTVKNTTLVLINQVDRFAADVTFSGKTLKVKKTNVEMELEKISAGSFNGKTYKPVDENVITLPSSLLDNVNGSLVNRLQFVYYASNTLFKAVWNSSSSATDVNSRVLAASVGRLSLDNLKDNVSIAFSHLITNATNPQCVYWDVKEGTWSGEGCSISVSTEGQTTCQCNHLTNFALLMDIYGDTREIDDGNMKALSIISYIGCGISSLGLILTIITYLMFRKLRKDNPSKILINLCCALLGVNIIFITGTIDTTNVIGCKISAALLHYFLLASFTWMAIESFYMYLALVLVFQTYYSRLLLKLCLVGWGVPLVAVIITISINTENYGSMNDNPGSYNDLCWLKSIAFYCAFLAPVGLILIVNFIAFGLVIRQLTKLSSGRAAGQADPSVAARLRGAISVMVLLGLTWVFALFAVGDAAVVFSYLFAIFNSLQGLALFVFYCLLKSDVQHAWMRALPCCTNPPDSRTWSKEPGDKNTTGKYAKITRMQTSSTGDPPQGTNSTGLSQQTHKLKAAAVAVQVSNQLAKHSKQKNNTYSTDTSDVNISFENGSRAKDSKM